MAYTVKRKIRYGTIFLFILLMILGGVSLFHISRLQNDSQIILKDNYESLDYSHQMLSALDSINYLEFERSLSGQEKNITEQGEGNATANIRSFFTRLKSGDTSSTLTNEIRANVYKLLKVNMAAIETKNNNANVTANKAVTYITLIAAVIFIVSLTFTYNFPSVITNPMNTLTQGIAEISAKNYRHRIHLTRKDEFGQVADAFNAMAERLEYFENSNLNQIIFEKTRAEAVINSLKDASIGIDKNGLILFANDQALQLLALKSENIVGKTIDEVSLRNDLFRFLLEEQNSMPFKIVVENRENYFIKEVIDIARDTSSGRVIVLKNITSFKELDVAKNNFIATISHELKTPLASSDFSLKLLQDERVTKLRPEQQELVENLQRDNQRMLKILSELLNISQVEAGKMQLHFNEVPPEEIANNAIVAVINTAKEKNITIEKNYGEHLSKVYVDSEKTGWVLNNLLINAIKYSKTDGVIIVEISQVDQQVRFTVKDHGPGIPAEFQSKVFDRFFKVPGSSSAGSGLGLTISKEFIEAMGGKLWVTSKLGEGSTFGFDLPRTRIQITGE